MRAAGLTIKKNAMIWNCNSWVTGTILYAYYSEIGIIALKHTNFDYLLLTAWW